MNKANAKYLVVVSIIEGRKFPKRGKHKLLVEAKFDGELLSTDPVGHTENPEFSQELAWELDRKSLLQHRLQRTTIKVQCYATDGTVKELIGYIILDLRVAQTKQVNKWHQLLNTKYPRSKPEICLCLYLDEDKGSVTEELNKKATNVNTTRPSPTNELRPILDEALSLYQIGPTETCADIFVLSITIAFASNLGQLIPTSSPLLSSSYFFYYSLFGNDVTNEVFSDLLHPNFPIERSSVKLRSNVDILYKFFSSQPGLQVHLCCGDQSLGSCEVPLNTLLKSGSTEIFMRPVTTEDTYRLIPPNKVKSQLPPFSTDTAPAVGISVVLKKEDNQIMQKQAEEITADLDGSYLSISPDKLLQTGKPAAKKTVTIVDDKVPKVDDKYSDDFDDDSSAIKVNEPRATEPTMSLQSDLTHPQRVHAASQMPFPNLPNQALSLPNQPTSLPTQPTHFTFSIDLRSVSSIIPPLSRRIFLRYAYPFFGSTTPITTYPPMTADPGQEVLLPQSFCAFDFACTLHQLQETFARVPLLVELWNNDISSTKDQLLGTVSISLSLVVSAQKTRLMNNGETGIRQVYSDRLPVRSVNGNDETCAELTFVLSLEDWGPLDSSKLSNNPPKRGNTGEDEAKVTEPSTETRDSAKYVAAVEVELWKDAQEKLFDAQLKQKESQYMKALAEEWKKRDHDREVILKKKMTEYTQLEEQLKKTITDLDKREKILYSKEQEVTRLRSDLQHEHEQKLQGLREASRRLKEDCDHQVNLERSKIADLEAAIVKHKQEVEDWQRKYDMLDKEFTNHKEHQNHTPEVRLQSQINLLNLEKVELERKLDAASKSKIHYKQQWGRALKEVARLKQKEQDTARAALRKQQEELEQLRLKYLAAEEKGVITGERRELQDIKNELNRLRSLEEEKKKEVTNLEDNLKNAGGDATNSPQQSNTVITTSDERLARLIEERDSLLRTGVYTSQDTIIAKLDKQIREFIAAS